MSTDLPEPLWSVAKVAEVLGCSREHVYRLADDGTLPAVNVGRARKRSTLRFLPSDVAAFVGNRRVQRRADIAEVIRLATPAAVVVPSRVKTRTR